MLVFTFIDKNMNTKPFTFTTQIILDTGRKIKRLGFIGSPFKDTLKLGKMSEHVNDKMICERVVRYVLKHPSTGKFTHYSYMNVLGCEYGLHEIVQKPDDAITYSISLNDPIIMFETSENAKIEIGNRKFELSLEQLSNLKVSKYVKVCKCAYVNDFVNKNMDELHELLGYRPSNTTKIPPKLIQLLHDFLVSSKVPFGDYYLQRRFGNFEIVYNNVRLPKDVPNSILEIMDIGAESYRFKIN